MKSDLLSILKKFTPLDNREMKTFLEGKYFPENKKSLLLFKEIIRFYPVYNITIEDKQKIFKKIYGNKPYNDNTFRSLIHLLLVSAENFLVIKNVFKNDFRKRFLLMKEIKTMNISDVLERMFDCIETDTAAFSSERLVEYYHLGIMKYNFNKIHKKAVNKEFVDSQIGIMDDSHRILTLHFFIESISNYINRKILFQKFALKDSSQGSIMDLINIKSYRKLFQSSPLYYLFDLYEKLLMMYANLNDVLHFYRFKYAVEEATEKLDKFEQLQHYSAMITYCIMKKNTKCSAELKQPLWEIYQRILEQELYSDKKNRYLDINLFRSILILGLELKKFSEIRELIDKYSGKVHPKEVVNISNLGNAFFYFEAGEFEKSLDYCNKISLTEFVFKYDIRNLLVKIHYELGNIESLSSILKSYNEFLRNDKLFNQEFKDTIKKFLWYTETLLKYNSGSDKTEMEFIMKQLSQETKIYAKDWLMEKYSSKTHNQLANVD